MRWQVEYNSRKSKEVKGNTEQPRTKITIIKKKKMTHLRPFQTVIYFLWNITMAAPTAASTSFP